VYKAALKRPKSDSLVVRWVL